MRRSLAAFVIAVTAVMIVLAAIRWVQWTYGTDTGTFAQIAANAFAGFTDGPERGTHFRFHWSPILAVLWPVVRATGSPLSIQIVQVALVTLTAVPLAAIVRNYTDEKWAVRAGVLALIYPPLLSAAFEEFHELAFYPVLVLTLIWAADRARWYWFALIACAIVLVREDACADLAIIGVALGVIGLLKRRGTQTGLLLGEPIEPLRLCAGGFGLALLSGAALAVYAFVVIPRAGRWAPSHFYHYPFADGPAQTVLAAFTHPLALAKSVLTFGRLTYVVEAFAPLAFLPIFTRWVWLAVPGLAGVLLANDSMVWHMGFHYELLWAPWLLLAASWAVVRIARSGREQTAFRWWSAAIGVSVLVLAAFNPMHPAHYLRREPYQHTADVRHAFGCVPHDSAVATHDEWFAHVALAYPRATNFDEGVGRFSGYLVYGEDWQNSYVRAHVLPGLQAARSRGDDPVICRYGTVVVLHQSTL